MEILDSSRLDLYHPPSGSRVTCIPSTWTAHRKHHLHPQHPPIAEASAIVCIICWPEKIAPEHFPHHQRHLPSRLQSLSKCCMAMLVMRVMLAMLNRLHAAYCKKG